MKSFFICVPVVARRRFRKVKRCRKIIFQFYVFSCYGQRHRVYARFGPSERGENTTEPQKNRKTSFRIIYKVLGTGGVISGSQVRLMWARNLTFSTKIMAHLGSNLLILIDIFSAFIAEFPDAKSGDVLAFLEQPQIVWSRF